MRSNPVLKSNEFVLVRDPTGNLTSQVVWGTALLLLGLSGIGSAVALTTMLGKGWLMLFAGFGLVVLAVGAILVRDAVQDKKAGIGELAGTVTEKWVHPNYNWQGEPLPDSFWIRVSGREFCTWSWKAYQWTRVGDEIVLKYYLHTKRVMFTERLVKITRTSQTALTGKTSDPQAPP